jgi:CRISPR-associated endonuclease/helicase Cas3
MPELLAKSDPPYTLKSHIEDGLRIAKNLQTAFPSTPEISELENFWKWLEVAIVFHDLGKGHSEFQRLLRRDPKNDWRWQRHELFSLPFAAALAIGEIEKDLLLRVIAGHHWTYKELTEHISNEYEDPEFFEVEFSKVDTNKVLKVVESFGDFQMQEVKCLQPKKVVQRYVREQLDGNIQQRKKLLLLTGAFKHCDHLSSAFVESIEVLEERHFNFLEKKRKDLQTKGADFYKHQMDAAQRVGSVILTAPTGAGKTETALLWLQKQLETTGQGRVFYTLPFTASINAMFERLSKQNPDGMGESVVGMLHGNLNAFLYERFFAEAGNAFILKDKIKSVTKTFRTLQTPLKITTPFQLLKHLFTLSGFEKGIFEWVGGYFIFDEIHAYNPSVLAQIAALLRFTIREMGAKVLIMTATLPSFLKRIFHELAQFDEIKAEPKLYEEFRRHRIKVVEGEIIGQENIILKELQAGKKVLVVCNTVLRAQEIYGKLKKDFKGDTLLLHGGFNGEDRMAIERQLQEQEPALLNGTQAIEVSLDIDYDMIFTELAPLDALLQRFGRVNRKREKPPCPCYVFSERNPKDRFIYSIPEVIENTLNALYQIEGKNGGIVSEAELQEKIDEVYPDFTPEVREEFDSTLKFLEEAIEMIYPMESSDQREEEFYAQFDGLKVLPVACVQEYRRRLETFDFIGAELLKVGIRKCNYARWKNEDILIRDQFAFSHPHKPKAKPVIVSYFILRLPYSKDLGLEKDGNPVSIAFFDNQL